MKNMNEQMADLISYIKNNFNVDSLAVDLIQNIVDYAYYRYIAGGWDENDVVDFLRKLLCDSNLGLELDEVKQFIGTV